MGGKKLVKLKREPPCEKEAFAMFETLMTTIKSKVVSAEFRCATAARLQAAFGRMQQMQTNAGAFDSAEAEPNESKSGVEVEQRTASSSSAKTIGDVFASMMNQNRMAAGVRPIPAAALQTSKPLNLSTSKPSAAVGRNDPCPCGSGKKYKKCCGKGLV